MYSVDESFRTGTAMFYAVLSAALFEIYRPAIEAELEKKLWRKLTDDERTYFIREVFKKVQTERQQEQLRRWFQHLIDRKIIHDFVWR